MNEYNKQKNKKLLFHLLERKFEMSFFYILYDHLLYQISSIYINYHGY